jgi:beta-aspartyl-peptidase (threonine type)
MRMNCAVLTHGGAGSPSKNADGCEAAARLGNAVLENGGVALEAALAATVALEDDPRFNAGTGSNLRLDGALIEMDASIMGSDGRFGAVACIQRVKNPILVAARVTETPHLLLVGEGATAFARRHGFADYDPTTAGARTKYARAIAELHGRGDGAYRDIALPWAGGKAEIHWNFAGEPIDCDTVGAVVRDGRGAFAATASTGGTTYMLRGRVGDSPLMGAGVFAGPHGAVAATGTGEEIVRRFLAKATYDWLAQGADAEAAADRAIGLFPASIDVGVLVIGRDSHAIRSNRDMAAAVIHG